MSVRESTNALLAAMDAEEISAQSVAEACLNYMSEDEVKDMIRANDFFLAERNDDDDDDD